MVARMFRICAAAATPCAWLPDEKATTPPPRSVCGIDDSLLKARRTLNDPVRCSISGLRKARAPVRSSSAGDDSSGVRTANGASTSAAWSISDGVTGRTEAGFVMSCFTASGDGRARDLRTFSKLEVDARLALFTDPFLREERTCRSKKLRTFLTQSGVLYRKGELAVAWPLSA